MAPNPAFPLRHLNEGGLPMRTYNLFVLDPEGRIVDCLPFSAADDGAALVWSERAGDGRRYELWSGEGRGCLHCTTQGPSVLEFFFAITSQTPALYQSAPVWYAACASH